MAANYLPNGAALAQTVIPLLSWAELRQRILAEVEAGARLAAFFGQPATRERARLVAILAHRGEGNLSAWTANVDKSFTSLTPDCPEAHGFEREIWEQCGLKPEGHPWLKPVRFQPPKNASPGADKTAPIQPGVTDYFQMPGPEIHEVAMGPVQADIMEPGHFRFQCHGEVVYHLEISLGCQHRGVERALLNGPHRRSLHHAGTLAGDTAIGHATAYCQALESLAGVQAPARAQALRAIALELERLANHTGDLGALAGDIGFLPTAAGCGRLRDDFLNLTALLCGSRFGRNFLRPGGVGYDVDEARAGQLHDRLQQAAKDAASAVALLWSTASVRARFENTGHLAREAALDLGLVGPAARACGLERDVRHEFPAGLYRFCRIPVATFHTGDVFGRAQVRWLEIQRSLAFIQEQLKALPAGSIQTQLPQPGASLAAVSLVEGWRGEICHVALTDASRRFAPYKVVDPSFHNWIGLALALRNQEISDFPLCCRSFNLSCCGHDL